MQRPTMNKLEIGDLLIRNNEVGIVQRAYITPYGITYRVYWTWNIEGFYGFTEIPDTLLSKMFFSRFQHIKKK